MWCLRVISPLLLFLSLLALPAAGQNLNCDNIEVFVREGCPHCDASKIYLNDLKDRYPNLSVTISDIANDQALMRFRNLNREYQVSRPGVPTFMICDDVLVGFDPDNYPARIESLIGSESSPPADSTSIELPVFGNVTAANLGLPVFTIAVGVVDGFNPCAMWVLLFLLSILVNVQSRARIVLIAGTFVAISGLVYFLFMAAWLNMFLVIGMSRALQIGLGIGAVVIGSIHIKDFFLLHRGVSLSIPSGAKPSLYARVRRIVHAEALGPALAGAALLALIVNLIELLCTAGLPALYTQVLTLYDLPKANYYGYLILYNVAYMADDALMVAIAVLTLGQRKLQERQGRWLKLLSGAVIALIGLLMLFAPQWLVL